MKAIIQRVNWAKVTVDDRPIGAIGPGILTFLGVGRGDTDLELKKLVTKILQLRIFPDDQGKMNRSIIDCRGEHLIVSQFTLYGDCSQGNRPGFSEAAPPEQAKAAYFKAIELSRQMGVSTSAGEFQADMKVELENDGPATFFLEISP